MKLVVDNGVLYLEYHESRYVTVRMTIKLLLNGF